MSYLDKLITLPDPRLRQKSQKVPIVTKSIRQLVRKMERVVLEWEETRPHEIGAALSAIQIAEPYRVVIVRQNFSDKNNRSFLTLVNPTVVKLEGGVESDYEGCLSVVDVYGLVPRHNSVCISAMGLDGKGIKLTAEGFFARVLQHEIDHTNGVMFIDHIKNNDAFYELDIDGLFNKISHQKILATKTLWDEVPVK